MESGNVWQPSRKQKRASRALSLRRSKVVSNVALPNDATKLIRPENPFLEYAHNEVLAIRCQVELGQLFTKYDAKFK